MSSMSLEKTREFLEHYFKAARGVPAGEAAHTALAEVDTYQAQVATLTAERDALRTQVDVVNDIASAVVLSGAGEDQEALAHRILSALSAPPAETKTCEACGSIHAPGANNICPAEIPIHERDDAPCGWGDPCGRCVVCRSFPELGRKS